MRIRRQSGSSRAARVASSLCLLALLAAAPSTAAPPPVASELTRAIDALLREKALRTPAQRKLGSRLLHADRMRRGVPIAEGIPSLAVDLDVDADGRVLVDMKADVSPRLLERIEVLGGVVGSSHARFDAIRARLPLDRLEELANDPAIRRIRPADRAFTRAVNVSEGDGAHRANTARSTYGIDGTGVAVGVISDGVDSLPSLVASGDLPAGVTVLPGQGGSGNEGAAMLEIVHDLAPGATLLFATALNSQASFASNILALRAAGADVIVDDVGYFAEGVFQDDDVAAAVDQVRADGALYFSAAGNEGNLDDGTAGVWEGDYQAGTRVSGLLAHDYGAGDITNQIVADSPYAFTLHWSDPLGTSSNDYDLFLTNAAGTAIVAASTDNQNGAGDPFEIIGSSGDDTGRQLIVVRHNGSASRFLHLNALRGRLEHATAGQTSGHSAARGAVSVAAVYARNRTTGFTGTESVETYSSDGPRRVFFEANGVAITPANFSATGGELRAKPDVTAADCISAAAPGFSYFCGTSAAAPHAAAIAALLIDRAGGHALADPAAIRSALTDSAHDIESTGPDRDAGAGIADALAAVGLVPPHCATNPDCDDGLFCNGTESCQAGLCVAGAVPTCTGSTPFCDETANACVACLSAANCSDGLYCNGVEACVLGACVAGSPPSCTAPTPFCDESRDACVACLSAENCSDGLFCNGAESCALGVCVSGSPPACTSPAPYCDEAADGCVQCLSSNDCGDGLFCNGSETCELGSCVAGAAPICTSPTPVCDDTLASCVGCTVDADCGAGRCVAHACTSVPGVPASAWLARAVLLILLAGVARWDARG